MTPDIMALIDALKLPPQTCRFVLEFEIGKPLRVFAVAYPQETALGALVKFVSGVSVSDTGEIETKPLPMTANARMLALAVLAAEDEVDAAAARALADEVIGECGG